MSDDSLRTVEIERTGVGRYVLRNARGGSVSIGTGQDSDFTPVELLLAALGGCAAVDVDLVTSRRAEPDEFRVTVTGDKIRDEAGVNRMRNLRVEFVVTFPGGTEGDAAREALPRIIRLSRERLCTVSRTVESGTPVEIVEANRAG